MKEYVIPVVARVPDETSEEQAKQVLEGRLSSAEEIDTANVNTEKVQELSDETDKVAKTLPDKFLPDHFKFKLKGEQDDMKKRIVSQSIAEQDVEDEEQDKRKKKEEAQNEIDAYEKRISEYIRNMSQEEKDVVLGLYKFATPEVRISKLSEHAIEKIETGEQAKETPRQYSEREKLYGGHGSAKGF